MRKTLSIVLIACLILALGLAAGCSKKTKQAAPDKGAPEKQATEKLVVGAIGEPHTAMLKMVKSKLAEQGVEMEIKDFTEYSQLNPALNDKQIDANFFQHLPYLEDFNAERGTDLVSVAGIHIEPLGIYSKTLTNLDDVPDGAVVTIPNDATNGGRALNLLAANALISLKADAGFSATVADIIDNPKNLKITELEAAQLVRALDDAALAVINGNYALEGGLTPAKDALALESAENNPYVNILAVKRGNENLPAIQKLIALLTSPEVKAFIEEKYAGSVLPAFGN